MEVRYILVETMREKPWGDVLGMFHNLEKLIDSANEFLDDREVPELKQEFKDKLLVKIDRDHYDRI